MCVKFHPRTNVLLTNTHTMDVYTFKIVTTRLFRITITIFAGITLSQLGEISLENAKTLGFDCVTWLRALIVMELVLTAITLLIILLGFARNQLTAKKNYEQVTEEKGVAAQDNRGCNETWSYVTYGMLFWMGIIGCLVAGHATNDYPGKVATAILAIITMGNALLRLFL